MNWGFLTFFFFSPALSLTIQCAPKGTAPHGLTHIHDLRWKHLPWARLVAGSQGDAGRGVADHACLHRPVHGASRGCTGHPHRGSLAAPVSRCHGRPRGIATNHSCTKAKHAQVPAHDQNSLNTTAAWGSCIFNNTNAVVSLKAHCTTAAHPDVQSYGTMPYAT